MLNNQKILITGGTGHLGNTLIKQLNKLNIAPSVIILKNDYAYPLKNDQYTRITGDITDRDFIFDIVKQFDIVIHLASQISIKAKDDYMKLYKVNVIGTVNIADACLQYNKKLIYASSVHTIPILLNNNKMREPTSFNIDSNHGNYEKTKSIATDYVYDLIHHKNLCGTIIYPSGIIGENDYQVSELATLFIDIANNKLPAYVKGGYAFVSVNDVASSIISIMSKEKYQTEYIISGQYLSIKDIIITINDLIGKKSLPVKVSINFVKIFIPLFTLISKIKNKKPLFTLYSLKTILSNSNFDTTKARIELGFNPENVRLTIKKALIWLLENKAYLFNKKHIKNIRLRLLNE